ncbi:YbaN family protein [Sphingomonas sp. GCM10030256]|uniref:YbaN family protein n=1 Tax=Sphingomonas sp. GCM10030256 TaxID=3273427 RepID=UPI00361DFC9E
MLRAASWLCGWLFLLIGAIGIVVPLLPTVVFWIVAAFFFSRGSPSFERWLLRHPVAGPHILAWRERRAISRRGKAAATIALAVSGLTGLIALPVPLGLVPAIVGLCAGGWIWTRPD